MADVCLPSTAAGHFVKSPVCRICWSGCELKAFTLFERVGTLDTKVVENCGAQRVPSCTKVHWIQKSQPYIESTANSSSRVFSFLCLRMDNRT